VFFSTSQRFHHCFFDFSDTFLGVLDILHCSCLLVLSFFEDRTTLESLVFLHATSGVEKRPEIHAS
jgi:hypothetical protein